MAIPAGRARRLFEPSGFFFGKMCHMPSQYRAIWSVPGGGTGYSVFHTDTAGDAATAALIAAQIRTFFNSLAPNIPDDVSITFDTEVLDLDLAGVLINVWAIAAPAAVVGGSSGEYSRAQGVRFDWVTGAIVNGHRLNGRTYIVPVISAVFDSTGLVESGLIAGFTAVGTALINNLNNNAGRSLEVWSRTHGVEEDVQSASFPRNGAILRTRRD